MIGRMLRGLPKIIDIASLSYQTKHVKNRSRGRRTLVAFLTGAGLVTLSLGSLEAGVAAGLIKSANSPISFIISEVQNRAGAVDADYAQAANAVSSPLNPGVEHKRKGVIVASAAAQGPLSLPRRSVCVRLCDGYFFPVGPLSRGTDLGEHEAACSGLCPDAPTQLFIEPAGSDRIEDAVSRNGRPYLSLPVALRNRAIADNTCTCHRRPGETFSLLNDFTLRGGDSIMTPSGIVVFRGAAHVPFARSDFTTLAAAKMPKDKRAVLAAIERAALPNMRQSSASLFATRTAVIAFAAPPPTRSKADGANKSIHFVESMISASN